MYLPALSPIDLFTGWVASFFPASASSNVDAAVAQLAQDSLNSASSSSSSSSSSGPSTVVHLANLPEDDKSEPVMLGSASLTDAIARLKKTDYATENEKRLNAPIESAFSLIRARNAKDGYNPQKELDTLELRRHSPEQEKTVATDSKADRHTAKAFGLRPVSDRKNKEPVGDDAPKAEIPADLSPFERFKLLEKQNKSSNSRRN